MGNDALAQLREIEHTLLFMYEEKDYIEKMALKSVSINRRHAEAEKAAEKARKQMRYEKKRKIEEEILR